jgi:Zn-dependent protease/CBS domain-containing protein
LRGSIKLFSIFGIPVEINATWFIAVAIITWSLSTTAYPSFFRHWATEQYWLAGILTTLLLFTSVLAHELGHSIVALAQGLKVSGITLLLFGGVSKIQGEARTPRNEFLIAFAGPAVSLVIGVALLAWWFAFSPVGDQVGPFHGIIFFTGWLNVLVAGFNMLPGYPMDGGRVLRSAVWGITGDTRRATTVAYTVGRYVFFAFIAWGALQIFNGDLFGGVWIILIGWFLLSSARNEVKGVRANQSPALSSVDSPSLNAMDQLSFDVGRATRPMPPMFEATWSVEQVFYQGLPAHPLTSIPIAKQGELIGFILKQDLDAIQIHKRVNVTVGELMDTGSLRVISKHEPALDALQQMDKNRVNQLVVMDEDFVIGIITRQDIVETLLEFRAANDDAGSGDHGTSI